MLASILARTSRRARRGTWRTASTPNLAAEKSHIFSATKELVGVAKQHLLSQMVPTIQMGASGRFRYSAPSAALGPWTDTELDELHRVWLHVHRSAWRLQPGFASGPFLLPEERGGCPVTHPRVLLIQALSTHVGQLCALPDILRQTTIERYRRLCDSCGCHKERELAEYLHERRTTLRCPIARLLRMRATGSPDPTPSPSFPRKAQRELSWYGLLQHLRALASAAEQEAQIQANVTLLAESWASVRRYLKRRGIRYPRMMGVNPRNPTVLWLMPRGHGLTRTRGTQNGWIPCGKPYPRWILFSSFLHWTEGRGCRRSLCIMPSCTM